MIVQVGNDRDIRLFDSNGFMICEATFPSNGQALLKASNDWLKQLRLRRRTKWQKTDWGYEVKVRF